MIFRAADNQRLESVFARDATEESPQIGPNIIGNQIAALFRKKDSMHKIRYICVRHAKASGVPTGRDSTISSLPGVETPGYYQASYGRFAFPIWGTCPHNRIDLKGAPSKLRLGGVSVLVLTTPAIQCSPQPSTAESCDI